MAFPKQMKRILGLSEEDSRVFEAPTDGKQSVLATNVGLSDAVFSGWFNNDTGELFRGVPIEPEDVVVDVGCGEGGSLAFCARRGAHVIAIDHDEQALEQARQKIEGTSARVKEYHVSTAEQLPIVDMKATRVVCTEVLEHVDDPAVVIRELVRIGAPGARYLITVPDPIAETVQQAVAPPAYFQRPNHLRIISRDCLRGLVEGAGLEIIEQSQYGFYWSVWWAMFWSCDVDLACPDHPVLVNWAQCWSALLETPDGRRVMSALNSVMPKSQIIVARKPC